MPLAALGPILAGAAGTSAAATTAAWGALGAGAMAGTNLIGAKMQSGAMGDAANAQQQSNAQALAFQRQQAQNEYQNQEVTRHANYDQWLSRQRGNNTVRTALGLKALDTPAYVPSVDPQFVSPAPPGVPQPPPYIPWGSATVRGGR